MKLKLYFLLTIAWSVPALGMEEQLTAETIVNHPRFLASKQAFEEFGAEIEVYSWGIKAQCLMEGGYTGSLIRYDCKDFFGNTEDSSPVAFFRKLEKWYFKLREEKMHFDYCKTLRGSLAGLCIIEIYDQYRRGNQGIIAELPEELKSKVELLSRFPSSSSSLLRLKYLWK